MGSTCSREASAEVPGWRQRRGARKPATTRATGNPFADSFVAAADTPISALPAAPTANTGDASMGDDSTVSAVPSGLQTTEAAQTPPTESLGVTRDEVSGDARVCCGDGPVVHIVEAPTAAAAAAVDSSAEDVEAARHDHHSVPALAASDTAGVVGDESVSTRGMKTSTRAPSDGSRSPPAEDAPLAPLAAIALEHSRLEDRGVAPEVGPASPTEANLISFSPSTSVAIAGQRLIASGTTGPTSNSGLYQGLRRSTSSGGRSFLFASTYFASRSSDGPSGHSASRGTGTGGRAVFRRRGAKDGTAGEEGAPHDDTLHTFA
mmetsp:Transcript_54288/g.167058  ORF Transcript_54288/g.167058 Transcript_54288/m.167058 type:complete len:320 (-) Transcript_54288:475-1434(-)